LRDFSVVISIFLVGFGISLQAILSPQGASSSKIFLDIIDIAYWPIYGEIKVLETIQNGTCVGNECLDSLSYGFSYMLIMVYMFMSSVLLLNLLIAMFR
jgi:hypothetical protein